MYGLQGALILTPSFGQARSYHSMPVPDITNALVAGFLYTFGHLMYCMSYSLRGGNLIFKSLHFSLNEICNTELQFSPWKIFCTVSGLFPRLESTPPSRLNPRSLLFFSRRTHRS